MVQPLVPDMKTLALDASFTALSGYSKDSPIRSSRPSDLAFILFTFDSTGQPKGGRHSHAGCVLCCPHQLRLSHNPAAWSGRST